MGGQGYSTLAHTLLKISSWMKIGYSVLAMTLFKSTETIFGLEICFLARQY